MKPAFKVTINKGVITERHLRAADVEDALHTASMRFDGVPVKAQPADISDGNMKVADMEHDKIYRLIAPSDWTNDVLDFQRKGSYINVSIIGGDFERPVRFWFDRSAVLLLEGSQEYIEKEENWTLDDLMVIAYDVYHEAAIYKELPPQFTGKVGESHI
ncbi:hypothetical protein [Aneurinibacillus tyrosinisolvens]|uniref:hypothetical protein n=1 Tax=Aneurinibacillus tyrosinisolvens TaxID=1443435 RepID=UPI00063EE562|nr:hypothetical protein [Aneurinibacillus tyrosinisolvens]